MCVPVLNVARNLRLRSLIIFWPTPLMRKIIVMKFCTYYQMVLRTHFVHRGCEERKTLSDEPSLEPYTIIHLLLHIRKQKKNYLFEICIIAGTSSGSHVIYLFKILPTRYIELFILFITLR